MHEVFVPPLHDRVTTEDVMPSELLELPRDRAGDGRVVALLKAGIPLSLLIDLAGSDPHSEELYELERAS